MRVIVTSDFILCIVCGCAEARYFLMICDLRCSHCYVEQITQQDGDQGSSYSDPPDLISINLMCTPCRERAVEEDHEEELPSSSGSVDTFISV